jgi:hypothetical protein
MARELVINEACCSRTGKPVRNCRCGAHSVRNTFPDGTPNITKRRPQTNEDEDDDDDDEDDELENSGATLNRRIRSLGGTPLVSPPSLTFNYSGGPAIVHNAADDLYGARTTATPMTSRRTSTSTRARAKTITATPGPTRAGE